MPLPTLDDVISRIDERVSAALRLKALKKLYDLDLANSQNYPDKVVEILKEYRNVFPQSSLLGFTQTNNGAPPNINHEQLKKTITKQYINQILNTRFDPSSIKSLHGRISAQLASYEAEIKQKEATNSTDGTKLEPEKTSLKGKIVPIKNVIHQINNILTQCNVLKECEKSLEALNAKTNASSQSGAESQQNTSLQSGADNKNNLNNTPNAQNSMDVNNTDIDSELESNDVINDNDTDYESDHSSVTNSKEGAVESSANNDSQNSSQIPPSTNNQSNNGTSVKSNDTDKILREQIQTYIDAQNNLRQAIDAYNALPEAAVIIPNNEPGKLAKTIVERGTDQITGYTHDVIAGIQYSTELMDVSSETTQISSGIAEFAPEVFGDTLTAGRLARTYKEYDPTKPTKAIALRDEHGTVTDHSTKNLSGEQKIVHAVEMAKLYARTYTGNGPIIIAGGQDHYLAQRIHATLLCLLPGVEIKNYVPNGTFETSSFKSNRSAAEKLVGKELLSAAIEDLKSSPKLAVAKAGQDTKTLLQELKKGQVTDVEVNEKIERFSPRP